MKPFRLAPAIAIVLASAPFAGALPLPTITEWTFEGLSTSGVNANPGPAIGSGTAAALDMNADGNGENSGISKIQGTDGSNNASSNLAWKVRGNNGWTASAAIAAQGAEFNVSTTGYTNITASFDWYPSTTGEANLAVEYSLNGGATWVDATAAQLTLPTSATLSIKTNSTDSNTIQGAYLSTTGGNTWYNNISLNLSSVAGAANDPSFELKLVNASTGADVVQATGGAAITTSGNWSFDDVTFSGSAIPEPSTYALILGVAALGTVLVRRRAVRA